MTDTHGAESATISPDDAALEALRASTVGTLIERMGITLDDVAPDRVTGSMPVTGNTQPAGLLHGGASVVLAETLGSIAAQIHAGEGRAAVGIEINATHHRGVRSGSVHGVATALHLGRTTASYEIVVVDDEGRRVCTARLTCMVLDGR
ncbi:hotdog fold thioesterase [Oerskovia paurometabola]|uniref:hotdog fold thioesterase n=1 Tax=Oerskovia paurometabola TaxID=162170 RepID=UPI00382F51E6